MIRAPGVAFLIVPLCAACGGGDGVAGPIAGGSADVHGPLDSTNAPRSTDPSESSVDAPPSNPNAPPPNPNQSGSGSGAGFSDCMDLCEPIYGCLFDCDRFCEAARTALSAECAALFFPLLACVVEAGVLCEDLDSEQGLSDFDNAAGLAQCVQGAEDVQNVCDFDGLGGNSGQMPGGGDDTNNPGDGTGGSRNENPGPPPPPQ